MPLTVAGLLVALLPVPLPGGAVLPESEQCLTLADTPAAPSASRALLERCSLIYPDSAELFGDLAAAYEAAGSDGQASTAYQRALSIDPEHSELRMRFGRLLLRSGEPLAAVREAQAALMVQPNRLAVHQLLQDAQRAAAAAER